MRALMLACLSILCCNLLALAQGNISIKGRVIDESGSAIPGAVVTATDLTSGAVARAQSGADGQFVINHISPDKYLVTVEKSGFNAFTQQVSLSTEQTVTVQAKLSIATLSQSVVVRGTVVPGARPQPTRDDVLVSDESLRVLDRKQLDAAGPMAGGAQMY
jgi:iron complex outermembrane recepter protein